MPRYANGSLEKTLYLGFKQAANEKSHEFQETPAKKERKNSVRSRAHRHEIFMAPDPVTCGERISAVRGVLKLLERQFCTPETAVTIIHNITKGE